MADHSEHHRDIVAYAYNDPGGSLRVTYSKLLLVLFSCFILQQIVNLHYLSANCTVLVANAAMDEKFCDHHLLHNYKMARSVQLPDDLLILKREKI